MSTASPAAPVGAVGGGSGSRGSGPLLMGGGLVLNGVATYVFLTVTARSVGPESFALVSVLWSASYLVGLAGFVPVEQELTRVVAARRAVGQPYGDVVRRLVVIGAVVLAGVAALVLVAWPWVRDAVFRGDAAFTALLVFGLAALLPMYAARGLLAGSERYGRYGLLFIAEAVARVAPALVLAAVGVTAPGPYGLLIGVGALVGAAVPFVGRRRHGRGGGAPPYPELARPVGFLMVTTALVAVMMNAGTIAVELLAAPGQSTEAGVFLSGLVIARIPVFLFQAIQALVLPRLTQLARVGDRDGFRAASLRVLGLLLALTVVAVAGSAAVGPVVLRTVFGPEYALLGGDDMALLTLGSMTLMLVFTVNQTQIALGRQRWTAVPWAAGVVGFAVVTALTGPELFRRVELGLAVGGVLAVLVAALLFVAQLGDQGSFTPSEERSTR